jgi:hypothetical protein
VLENVAEAYDNLKEHSLAIRYAHESVQNGFSMVDLQTRPALQSALADPSFHNSGKN